MPVTISARPERASVELQNFNFIFYKHHLLRASRIKTHLISSHENGKVSKVYLEEHEKQIGSCTHNKWASSLLIQEV